MMIVGLTGGIGSGKSAVAGQFAELGVPVIDTDVIARELVSPGLPAFDAIVATFGQAILLPSGELDRPQLRQRIIDNETDRKRLEAILHPLIRDRVREQLGQLDACYCIVVIPLLAESGGYEFLDRVLVVDCPVELQLRRTCERDEIDRDFAEQILAIQAGREQRLALADDIVINDKGLAELEATVRQLHDNYMNSCNK